MEFLSGLVLGLVALLLLPVWAVITGIALLCHLLGWNDSDRRRNEW